MNATAPLNWLHDPDAFTRPGAVELQSAIHQNLMKMFSNADTAAEYLMQDHVHWRRMALVKSQNVMGANIAGTVLEIGAGTGWCSSLLSLMPGVSSVYCVDYDPVSVNHLMPKVQECLGAQAWKIKRVLGSFNSIPLNEEVDYIASIGALHHSENLYETLAQCFHALKPGGWLFASEPIYPDSESNLQIRQRYKKEDANSLKKYGKITKHEDNSDHYYRLAEFVTACYAAKFDVYPFVFDLDGSRMADDRTLAGRQTSAGFHLNVLYPYFAKNPAKPMFDKLMLMLQKPKDGGHDVGHILAPPPKAAWQK